MRKGVKKSPSQPRTVRIHRGAPREAHSRGGHLHLEGLRERCSVRGKFMNALFFVSVSSIRTRPRLRLDFSLALHLLAFFVFVSFDSY